MTTVSSFESAEQLEEMIKMGMEEGMGLAMGQIDTLLAARRAFGRAGQLAGSPARSEPGKTTACWQVGTPCRPGHRQGQRRAGVPWRYQVAWMGIDCRETRCAQEMDTRRAGTRSHCCLCRGASLSANAQVQPRAQDAAAGPADDRRIPRSPTSPETPAQRWTSGSRSCPDHGKHRHDAATRGPTPEPVESTAPDAPPG